MTEQEFQIGDKAVVPQQGVGIVKEIGTRSLGGGDSEGYVIKMLDNGVSYFCPIGMAAANNVRDVMPAEMVGQVYVVLEDRDKPPDKQTWNRRYREYTKKINTNDPLEIAAVLRDLAVLRLGKTLSFGERKMYDRAHALIVQEIAAVRDVDEELIKKEIEEIFAAADAKAHKKAAKADADADADADEGDAAKKRKK